MSGAIAFAAYAGPCWRWQAGAADRPTGAGERAGCYNRAGERTLYMSGSPAGVAAAVRDRGAGWLLRWRSMRRGWSTCASRSPGRRWA